MSIESLKDELYTHKNTQEESSPQGKLDTGYTVDSDLALDAIETL